MAISCPAIECTHTARVKRYPDGSLEIMAASAPLWRDAGWEPRDGTSRGPAAVSMPSSEGTAAADRKASLDRSQRRARAALRDKALCTPMRYFITLTLDPARVRDRRDMAALVKLLRAWLDNRVRRKGLAYVLVPERHQDGALHLHGLVTGGLVLRDSGTVKRAGGGKPRKPRSAKQRGEWLAEGGQVVYNVADWPWGFSTALELRGEYAAAVGYVCKYISKDAEKIGGRWYFSGGDLGAPEVSLCDLSFEDVAAMEGAYVTDITPVENWGFSLAIFRTKCAENAPEIPKNPG